LLATRFELVNSALSEGTRADGFEPVFSFVSFDGPLDCPADTAGAEVCAPLYPRLLTSLGLGGGSDTGGGGGAEGGGGDGTADGYDAADSAEPSRGDGASSKGGEGCGKAGLLLLLPFGLIGVRRRIGGRHIHASHGTAEGEGGHSFPDGGVEVAAVDE